MKRFRFFVVLLLPFLLGMKPIGFKGKASSSTQASVLKDTIPAGMPGVAGSAVTIGDSASEWYMSSNWTASSSYTCTQLTFQVYRTGTGQNLTCYIYSDTGSAPNALLATSTTTITAASIVTNASFDATNDVLFSFAGQAITNGTSYYAVLKVAGVDGSNRDVLNMDNGAPGTGKIVKGDATPAWSDNFATRKLYVRIYGF
jgi:hypothetical protein